MYEYYGATLHDSVEIHWNSSEKEVENNTIFSSPLQGITFYELIRDNVTNDPLIDKQTGRQPNDMKDRTDITKVSFMIFRTGSVLIVGKCEEDVLQEIYLFIRSMLEAEYKDTHINQQSQDIQMEKVKIAQEHNRKIKKRTIIVYTPAQSSQLI